MNNLLYKNFVNASKYGAVRSFCGRSFSRNTSIKVLLVCESNRISYSQAYPFMYYRDEFYKRFGAQFRLLSLRHSNSESNDFNYDADIVLFQTWFDIEPDELRQLVASLKEGNPNARLHFLDSFAPTDLRLSRYLETDIDSYIKKSVLKDKSSYLRPLIGDTNLSEFYSELCNVATISVDWKTPESIFEKLKIGPTFHTGPGILEVFEGQPRAPIEPKSIDLHARIATKGSPWYQSMRELSERHILNLQGLNMITGMGIPHKQFLEEMRASKACISPFGYGEVCWRDIEAIQSGSVLIKPSMEHLDMDPIIHIPNETYIPVAWDFSDLEERTLEVLNNDDLRKKIAENAYDLVRKYIVEKRFVDQFSYLFDH